MYGDGVNVAARLEQLAEPGGICVSGKIYEEVRDKLPYTFEDRGEQQVKNIARPIRTYSHVGGRQQLPGQAAVPLQSVSDRPSVAVLPFKNISENSEQSYFSDGLTEDVITEMSRFRELMVISQHSSFSFRGQSLDVREIGRLLSSEYMVEGSVRRAGDRLRITAQLLHCASGANLWGERYDRAVNDVFAIQEEIAQSIVATVVQRVVRDSELAARRRVPENIRAYDLFLQGNHLTDAFAPEAQARAEVLFKQALQIDPGFARAHTGLAWIYRNRSEECAVGVPRAKDENKIKALHEAEQALALDPNDARVHFTQGYMNLMWRDFVGGERHMDLARRMNPNDATIQVFWAWVQSCLGYPERSLPAAEIALRLNPCHPTWYNFILAQVLFSAGRYEEAAAHLARLASATPARHSRNMAWCAAAYGHSGDLPGAARCAGIFVEGFRKVWRGDASAGPREYVNWLVDTAHLKEAEDEQRLRGGLRIAGLPA